MPLTSFAYYINPSFAGSPGNHVASAERAQQVPLASCEVLHDEEEAFLDSIERVLVSEFRAVTLASAIWESEDWPAVSEEEEFALPGEIEEALKRIGW